MVIDGLSYETVEHYYQSMKADNPDEARKIRLAGTPGKAKGLGRKCRMKSNWESIKTSVMMKALREKFKIPNYRKSLLSTPGEIVEYNKWHDNEWGHCVCQKCKNKTGKNLLGKLLMQLRDELNGSN